MTTLAAATRLTSALADIAAALAAADTAGLLATEEPLSSALADLSRGGAVPVHERAALARELVHAAADLARCRVLGRAGSDATQATLVALGRRSPEYRSPGDEMSELTDVAARGVAVERSM